MLQKSVRDTLKRRKRRNPEKYKIHLIRSVQFSVNENIEVIDLSSESSEDCKLI